MKFIINFLIFIYLINNINCLFEDQVGSYDWRQQYIGRPLFSHIDLNKNKIFLATDQRLLVALNKKTGNIVWRKIFENNNFGDVNYVIWANKEILVIKSNGRNLQSFNYNHGYLTFEFSLFKNNSADLKYYGFESKIESEAYYLTNGYELCYLNSNDKSCTDLSTESGHVFNTIYETEQGVFAFGINDKSIIKIQFNGLLNTQLSKLIYELPSKSNINCLTNENNQLQCLVDYEKLYISDIKASNLQFTSYSLPFKLSENYKIIQNTQSNLVIENDSKIYLFEIIKESGSIAVHKTIENFVSYYTKSYEDDKYLVVVKLVGNKNNFYTYNIKTGNERSDLLTTIEKSENKNIIFIDGSINESKSKQLTINHFCFYEDYSMILYSQNGNKIFTREEALSNIVSVEMIDFPLTTLQEEFEDEFGSANGNLIVMFIKRIKSQIFQLKEFFGEYLRKLLEKSKNLNNENYKEVSLKRDEFNLNKLLVIVTSIGKIFGLHSSNGQIMWSFYLSDSLPFKTLINNNKQEQLPLFVQRTSAHYPYEAQCAIVSQYKKNDKKTLITYFNPLNGELIKTKDDSSIVDFKVKQVYLSNIADNHFLKALIMLDNDNNVHILPKSSENLIFNDQKPHTIFNADKNSLSGFAVTKGESIKLWNINLDDETIISIGAKNSHDRVHSHGKVLGDRSVLYKYLNPNMIAVVTEGIDNQKTPFLNVYIIDTVNGNIITSFNHKRTRGPVQIVHSENWFFFSYYNLKFRRHEVTSIELFEGSTQHNSTHFSSFDAIKPVVYSKSYIIQKSIDAMQITLTEKGITTKDVIVATTFGTIIEIPWVLIDARRPLEMTEVDREENLIPYMPEIPLNYEFSLNYYNYVYNIKGITTSSSGLESTSLVFAHGLDLFFTRVFPSKTFDMLREDFDYFFIITLMIGLLLGTLVSKKLASSSNLSKAWK